MTVQPNDKTTDRVLQALTNNGYGVDDIMSARFVKHANGNEVHRITFKNDDGLSTGYVYLYYANGKLVAEF
jgi:hypothetical protein